MRARLIRAVESKPQRSDELFMGNPLWVSLFRNWRKVFIMKMPEKGIFTIIGWFCLFISHFEGILLVHLYNLNLVLSYSIINKSGKDEP